uniref:RUN domain-containing protein n=1 Tax=Macrostomum lignano TaxID=282301 RepID=A0A1I8HSG0_9PLAT
LDSGEASFTAKKGSPAKPGNEDEYKIGNNGVKYFHQPAADVDDGDDDEDDDDDDEPPLERWAPLGASNPDAVVTAAACSSDSGDQLRNLREEQEQLTNSLMSLTSHFAQVQFRLTQVLDAPPEEREAMLRQLEEFSSRGVPDLRSLPSGAQRDPSQQLISQLRSQLDELEKFACDTGQYDGPPTLQQLEQHRVVMETLRSQLHVEVPTDKQLSADEVKQALDSAVTQIVHPAKVKEQLVEQLKTQITDLERFIDFLQEEITCVYDIGESCSCKCHDKLKKANLGQQKDHSANGGSPDGSPGPSDSERRQSRARLHAVTVQMMRRAIALLQMVAVSQLGCGGQLQQGHDFGPSGSNQMKSGDGAAARHFGDLRARLEVAVTKVVEVAEESRSAEHEDLYITSEEVLLAVRKELCPALRDLLLHGLALPSGSGIGGGVGGSGQSGLVSLLGCFSVRRRPLVPRPAAGSGVAAASSSAAASAGGSDIADQVWSLFAEWFRMKGGQEYTDSPARKLSESFSLSMVGSRAVTVKEELLSAIHHVNSLHEEWGRGGDPRFKALVSLALNRGKLVPWLRLIVLNTFFLDNWWTAWSYTAKTGWSDAFHALNRLAKIPFQLPCDLAVRQFTNMNDAF